MRLFLVGLVALLVGFLLGWTPLYLELKDAQETAAATEERLQAELSEAQRRLAVSTIHSRLAILRSQVAAEDFQLAQQTSTAMYDQVDGALASLEAGDDQRRLLTIKETRDEVTAKLAVADASVLSILDRLFSLLGSSL